MYNVSDFDYHLPSLLIAQKPAKPRDKSRLLLLNKKTGEIEHHIFSQIIDYLQKGDLLILNNSKVFPARLIGHKKDSGGEVEVFLHQKKEKNFWQCLLRGKMRVGLVIKFPEKLEATVLKNNNDGTWLVAFNLKGNKFWQAINKFGQIPLPPYIKRIKQLQTDKKNYQTVFADSHKVGSVAAPTAGLHFTKTLLKKIKEKGVIISYVTLHVGLGTFSPVKVDKIKEHKMHSEFAEIKKETIQKILDAKKVGHRIIAVGTTSCRTLESINFSNLNADKDYAFSTDIFIYPGFKFKNVDALITNFHLPKSTLLMLVSALAGKKRIDKAYRAAVEEEYRFFSYGDAMYIY